MRGRGAPRRPLAAAPLDEVIAPAAPAPPAQSCWLCGRPLGARVEWHHPKPKSRGGKHTEPVHPICHRALHSTFSNAELARDATDGVMPAVRSEMSAFLQWISGKPADFNAPTRRRR